ncbi:MAG: hypothetical protein U5K81_04195 [Trueperaceae bacterium]|nr:hypothetical protein [Trueperaceae bacterium]
MNAPELHDIARKATAARLRATLAELFPVIHDADPPLLDSETDALLGEVAKAAGVRTIAVRQDWENYLASREDGKKGEGEKRSQASSLIELTREKYRFGISASGETFGVLHEGPQMAVLMRGGQHSLRAQLARDYFQRHGRAASQQALADALLTLDGFAQEAEPERLYQRVAEYDGAWWLDMGDNTGRAIRICDGEWTIEQPPVLFKRTPLTGALPTPESGGDIDELWHIANVTSEDRPLLVAYLIASLRPDIAHPILGLFGEHGAGKTTVLKALVLLLDSGPVPYRKPPRDADSWVTAAAGSWLVGIDNLTAIPDWLSDCLCRAVTGDGDVRRKLYTDGQLATFAFRRVLALTGIDLGALNGDLTERLLHIQLEEIEEEQREDEEALWHGWADRHPRLLGAFLDLAARVAAILPTVHLARKPRMADFARILAAVDRVLGTNGVERYMSAAGRMAADSLTGDTFVATMQERLSATFEGTSGDLLRVVTPSDDKWRRPKDWPTTVRAVTQRLRKQAPMMRKAGWEVTDDGGANKAKVVTWRITPPGSEGDHEPDPRDPPHPPKGVESRRRRAQHFAPEGSVSPASDPPAGQERLPSGGTRGHTPPTAPLQEAWPTRDSLRGGGAAGLAGRTLGDAQDDRDDRSDLSAKAAHEVDHFDGRPQEEVRHWASTNLNGAPVWWESTILTEPLAVAVALRLIDRHEVAPSHALNAARAAVRGNAA